MGGTAPQSIKAIATVQVDVVDSKLEILIFDALRLGGRDGDRVSEASLFLKIRPPIESLWSPESLEAS